MKVLLSLFCTLFLVAIFALEPLNAQTLPPNQPEQDCVNAIPVCQGTYFQPNSYTGPGLIPNEIDPIPSCLNGGEVNDVWYIFTVQTAGMLAFSITPVNISDDYDWAVYDLTNHSCSDIFGTPSLEVSCNWSGVSGITGPNGLGGAQNNPMIPVTAGQTFVVNVSNWSGTGTGYTLDFTLSSATIFDNIPPEVDVVSSDCSGNVSMTFTENIVCSTVDLTDFTVTDLAGNPYTINSVTGVNCAAGGTFEDEFMLNTSPPFVSGDYIISLVDDVEDNCGNIGIYGSDTITIVLPNINVVASSDTICDGQSATISTPVQPGYTYIWSPGSLPGNSINVSPSTTTTYTVSATDASGCVFTGSTTLEVIPTPISAFTATPNQVCPDDLVDVFFTGSSLPAATFSWDFDGGTIVSGSGSGPYQISWQVPGTQSLTLDIDQFGCTSSQAVVPVTVYTLPTATFLADPDVCVNSTASIAYAGNASPTATYSWDFDGGLVVSGSGQGPYTVEWNIPGPKNICLIVEENGCISTTQCHQLLVNALPVITIQDPVDQCLKGNEFSFAYTGVNPATSYQWDLGEAGASSTLASPVHSYSTFGPKVVTLTITDENGCVNTGSTSIEVFPSPTADFSFSPVCFGEQTPFTDQSQVDNSGPISLWQWTFGTQGGSVDQHPEFVFNQYGFHSVNLEVISVHGCRDTIVQDIEVFDQPIAGFEFVPVCENETLAFSNTSEFNNPQVSYEWNFGDGNTSTQRSPDHLYAGFGVFLTSMTIATDEGCTDTYQEEVDVFPLPTAEFVPDSSCHTDMTMFRNTSSVPNPGEVQMARWDFGNGSTSTDFESRFRFPEPGMYEVELWVSTQHGCLDSVTQAVPVYPNPQGSFYVIPACETDSIQFINQYVIADSITQDFIASYTWDFGDGSQDFGSFEPQHLYFEDGVYSARLTATSDKGCVRTSTRQVNVWPNPEAPTLEEDTVCFGAQAFLLAYSTDTSSQIRWYYDLSDQEHFREAFTYPTPPVAYSQTYYVEAISAKGCVSTRVPIEAFVFEGVEAKILLSQSVVEIPQALVNLSVAGLDDAQSYSWNLGDGNTASTPALVHEYEYPGKYEIGVKIITKEGCEVVLREVVEVKQVMGIHLPTAFTPNGDGFNDEYYIGSSLIRQVQFEVFDRWGGRVFIADQPDFRWDGLRENGKEALPGVYVFRLKGIDYQGNDVEKVGTITLIR